VKVKETVSDEAREDKWGVRSIDKVQQRGLGRWTSKSDHRWRTCVTTLNRNQVVEILRLVFFREPYMF